MAHHLTRKILVLVGLGLMSGCNQVDEAMISTTPVDARQAASAAQAARICARHAPDWQAAERALLAAGYAESSNARLVAVAKRDKAVFLEDSRSPVIVQLGSRGGEGACIVGLPGLTPQQSYRLALPWVAKYDLKTNAERGQGLSASAVQVWGRLEPQHIIYVAAYKTWDVLEEPGAAARLLYISR